MSSGPEEDSEDISLDQLSDPKTRQNNYPDLFRGEGNQYFLLLVCLGQGN